MCSIPRDSDGGSGNILKSVDPGKSGVPGSAGASASDPWPVPVSDGDDLQQQPPQCPHGGGGQEHQDLESSSATRCKNKAFDINIYTLTSQPISGHKYWYCGSYLRSAGVSSANSMKKIAKILMHFLKKGKPSLYAYVRVRTGMYKFVRECHVSNSVHTSLNWYILVHTSRYCYILVCTCSCFQVVVCTGTYKYIQVLTKIHTDLKMLMVS